MANSISLLGNNLYHLTLLYWLVSVFFCITFTHWGRATHICVSKLTITGSDNGLSPGRRQAINWTNDGILLIRTLGTNSSEILSEIHAFSFQENASENVVCEMASILSRPQCVKVPDSHVRNALLSQMHVCFRLWTHLAYLHFDSIQHVFIGVFLRIGWFNQTS